MKNFTKSSHPCNINVFPNKNEANRWPSHVGTFKPSRAIYFGIPKDYADFQLGLPENSE